MVQVCSSLLVSSISSSHSSSSSVAFYRAKYGLGLAKPCVSCYLHKLRRLAPPRRETSLYCSDWATKRMAGRGKHRDSSKICRLCLGKEVKLTRPFKDQVGTNTALLQKIYECTTVKVSFPVVK
uniref:(northern house mosquito) hypothetical protein n=1 Tax=Culex pipiens TaxID=7175 RepID=A0A8D8ACB6_CULPI